MNRRLLCRLVPAFVILLSLIFSPALRQWTQKVQTSYRLGESQSDVQRRNQGAFARALGELRATASDLMFVKMNLYVHAGVAYDTSIQVSAMESHHDLGDAGAPTVIRSAAEDFRGFLGELEREVKPYRDRQLSHIHTTKGELTPWFRVMTLANPQFIRGYRVGGLTIADEGRYKEALDFMMEGVRNNQDNPELFLLHLTIASFHRRGMYNSDYPWGDEWLDRSLYHALKGWELGKELRPSGWTEPKLGETLEPYKGMVWTVNVEEDFQLGVHLVPQLLRERYNRDHHPEDLRLAVRYAREISDLLPHYRPMRRLLGDLEAQAEKELGPENSESDKEIER